MDTVDRLIGEETSDEQSNLTYSGTVAQIFALGGFSLKVIVRDGESRPKIIDKLGGRERGVVKSLGQPLHRLGGQPQGGNNTVFQYGVIAIIPKIEKDLLYIQN